MTTKTLAARNYEHLLIVDDDRGNRDLLRRFLTKRGHRVTARQDPPWAVERPNGP